MPAYPTVIGGVRQRGVAAYGAETITVGLNTSGQQVALEINEYKAYLQSVDYAQSAKLKFEDYGSVIANNRGDVDVLFIRNDGVPQIVNNATLTIAALPFWGKQVERWGTSLIEAGTEGFAAFGAREYDVVGTPIHEYFRCRNNPTSNETACFYNDHWLIIGVNSATNRNEPALDPLQVSNGWGITITGTAAGGSSTTITLEDADRRTNDYYNGYTVQITGGTGSGQSRTASDYVNSTNAITVSSAWSTPPDNTSTYSLTPATGAVGKTPFRSVIHATRNSLLTSAIATGQRINHRSTGVPVEGFGVAFQYAIQGSGITERVVANTEGYLTDDTRSNGALRIKLLDNSTLTEKAEFKNDGLHLDDGLGVWFKTPPTSQAVKINDPTDLPTALTAIASILDVLESYGFAKEDNYTSLVGKAIAYWPMQETSGTTISDSKGVADGTLTVDASTLTTADGPSTMSSNLPKSLTFSGSEWIHSAGGVDTFKAIHETNIWTFAVWIKIPTLSGRYMLFGSSTSTLENGFFVEWSNGVTGYGTQTIRVQVNKGASPPVVACFSTNNIINDNDWHHIAVTSGSGTSNQVLMYVDGSLRFPTNYTTSVSSVGSGNATRTLKIADTNDATAPFLPFVGQMCGVGIWDFALTPTKIDLLVNEP